MNRMLVLLAMFAIGAPSTLSAQEHTVRNAVDMKWAAGPAALPPGAQVSVLLGDPGKEGLYVIRLKFPAGYRIPAHTHPHDEHVTVIFGAFHFGMGSRLDDTRGL